MNLSSRRGSNGNRLARKVSWAIAILAAGGASASAQLATYEYSGVVTHVDGNYEAEPSLRGSVGLGSTLNMSFTFDPTRGPWGVSSPDLVVYFQTGAPVRATFEANEFSYELPEVKLDLRHNGGTFAPDGRFIRGDSAHFWVQSLELGNPSYVTFSVSLVYPPGTLDLFNPVIPEIDPWVVHMQWSRTESEGTGLASSVFYPNGPPEFRAVPEPATYGWMGAALLGAFCVARHRRGRRVVPFPAAPRGQR